MYTHTHTNSHIRTQIHIYTYIFWYTYKYIHIYIYIYIYIYTHQIYRDTHIMTLRHTQRERMKETGRESSRESERKRNSKREREEWNIMKGILEFVFVFLSFALPGRVKERKTNTNSNERWKFSKNALRALRPALSRLYTATHPQTNCRHHENNLIECINHINSKEPHYIHSREPGANSKEPIVYLTGT